MDTHQLTKNVIAAMTYARAHVHERNNFILKSVDDPVTEVDKAIEEIIYQHLPERIGRNGEEFGSSNLDSEYVVHVDPLDGTKDYVRGHFNTTVSVALTKNQELIYGAIGDVMRDILYLADETSLSRIFFATDKDKQYLDALPQKQLFKRPTVITEETNGGLTKHLLDKGYSVRRPGGSMALSMAVVASGSIDALVSDPHKKNGLSDIADIAAGVHQLRHSTAPITTRDGSAYNVWKPYDGIIAARPEIDAQLRKDIAEYDALR